MSFREDFVSPKVALALDHAAHSSAAREIIATKGEEFAREVMADARTDPGVRVEIGRLLEKLPAPPQRRALLRRWAAESHRGRS